MSVRQKLVMKYRKYLIGLLFALIPVAVVFFGYVLSWIPSNVTNVLVGGSATLLGSYVVNEYQSYVQRENTRQALLTEVRWLHRSLEFLYAALQIDGYTQRERPAETFNILTEQEIDAFEQEEHKISSITADSEYNFSTRIYDVNLGKIGTLSKDEAYELIAFYSNISRIVSRLNQGNSLLARPIIVIDTLASCEQVLDTLDDDWDTNSWRGEVESHPDWPYEGEENKVRQN